MTRLRQQVRSLQRENIKLCSKLCSTNKKLEKFLRDDQIHQLNGTRCGKWSSDTIRSALKIRTAVGRNGYEFLRKEILYSLPSYRTLCNRVETLRMAPGLQEDILDLLEIKTKGMSDRERDCVLILDEVQVKRKIEYDTALKCLTGYVSQELRREVDEEASHALVFMIKGLCKPYKQCVAWYLTGNGTSEDKLWSLTKQTLEVLHKRSMRVRVITSDMGPSNVGMWKAAGLDIHTSTSNCSIRIHALMFTGYISWRMYPI